MDNEMCWTSNQDNQDINKKGNARYVEGYY